MRLWNRLRRRTVYVVQRINVHHDADANEGYWGPRGDEPIGPPLQVFEDEGEARAFRSEQEKAARAHLYPFRFSYDRPDLGYGGPEPELLGLVELWRLPAPDRVERQYGGPVLGWIEWWDAHYPDLTPDQRTAIWSRFHELKLFVVTTAEWED